MGKRKSAEKDPGRITFGRVVRRFLGVTLTVVFAVLIMLVGVLFLMMRGPSASARDLTVTTFLESGSLKFVPHLFLSNEDIQSIVDSMAMEAMDTSVLDASLVDNEQTGEEASELDMDAVEIKEISGRTYYAKLMIVNDPSRVRVASTYPFQEYGINLDEIVENAGALGGVNGGLYANLTGTGGWPRGLLVVDGEIQHLDLDEPGIFLIGLDNENLLQIIDMRDMTNDEAREVIEERGIRDAVAFQEETSDANNHFVPLVINGKPRELNGLGSGANPRTAIGQRADGAIMLLVTDGRGTHGHLGATASDLVNIMVENGAVNAANLDGGSSSSMYYDGSYEMTSVTLYYQNGSWRMPAAIVVDRR